MYFCLVKFFFFFFFLLDIIHKFVRDKYSKRFPELESLVPNTLDYIRAVKVSVFSYTCSVSNCFGSVQSIV